MIRKFIKYIKQIIRKNKLHFHKKGENVIIDRSSCFYDIEKIELGNNIWIGPNSKFFGYGGIKIGSGTIIAHNVEIMTRNHNYDSQNLKSIPYDNNYIYKNVEIGENVWIGSNVLIVPGVKIGEGVVVGMGSVVTKNVAPYSIIGGNPAKVLKKRNEEIYTKLKNNNKIYLELKNK